MPLQVSEEEIDAFRKATFEEMDRYYDSLIDSYPEQCTRRWNYDFTDPDAYRRSVLPNRVRFLELMGGWPWERGDRNSHLHHLGEVEGYQVYRAFLPAFPRVRVHGILLVPKGKGPFAAVIAQHGFGGSPEAVCGLRETPDIYRRFGQTLVQRGYVVFAPTVMNNARDRSWLNRKAVLVGQYLMGLEMFKISRTVDYLASLEYVERIGMYGLSQGGMSTLWASAVDERIAAAVVSGYFNHRAMKLVKRSPHYTAYIDTPEDDKFFPGQLLEFSDAEIASLIWVFADLDGSKINQSGRGIGKGFEHGD